MADIRSPLEKLFETTRWEPILQLIGLDEIMAERLMRLLVTHLILDRLITAKLAIMLRSRSSSSDFKKVEKTVASLTVTKRVDLAKALGIVSNSWVTNFAAVNSVRNKLAHYNPKVGWHLDKVTELSSAEAFEECAKKGMLAITGMTNGRRRKRSTKR